MSNEASLTATTLPYHWETFCTSTAGADAVLNEISAKWGAITLNMPFPEKCHRTATENGLFYIEYTQ